MTRIFADPDRFVADAFRGFALAHADTVRLVDGGVVRARALSPGSVAVLIGGAVREHRTGRGWSTRSLAARAGISQPFLTNIENGRTVPSLPSLYAIATALAVSCARCIGETPRKVTS